MILFEYFLVDCILSIHDEPWSECSVTCGSGVITTKKRVISVERNGGACDNPMKTQFCKKDPCPCVQEWTDWSACSVECGDGIRTRNVTTFRESDFGGGCPELPDNAYEVCSVDCQANTRTMDQDQDLILTTGFIIGMIIGSIVILVILILMSVVIIYQCRRKNQTRIIVEKVPVPMAMEAYDNEEEADDDNEEDIDDQQPSVPNQEDNPYADQDYTDYQDEDDDYENGPRGLGGDYYTYYDEDGRFVRTNTIHYR